MQLGKEPCDTFAPVRWSLSSHSSQITEVRKEKFYPRRILWFHMLPQTLETDTSKCLFEIPSCSLSVGWQGFSWYWLLSTSLYSSQGTHKVLPSSIGKRCLWKRSKNPHQLTFKAARAKSTEHFASTKIRHVSLLMAQLHTHSEAQTSLSLCCIM